MELVLSGVGIILSILTWQFMWKPTVLDAARDKLFDLRDREVRGWFVKTESAWIAIVQGITWPAQWNAQRN